MGLAPSAQFLQQELFDDYPRACHSLTYAEAQPISLWPAESDAPAGFVVVWLSMISEQ